MKKLEGIIFSDLGRQCQPSSRISTLREMGKWNAVDYETGQVKGTLLSALDENKPLPVTLDPHLKGWHRIFLGIVATTANNDYRSNFVPVRLTGDDACTVFTPTGRLNSGSVEDVYWKSADMTGQAVEISRFEHSVREDAIIAWIRFEPMTDGEVSALAKRLADPGCKRVYATNDMHCMGWRFGARSQRDWDSLVQMFEQSDVEWLSVENLYTFNGKPAVPYDRFAFPNPMHESCQRALQETYTDDMLSGLVRLGHRLGIKMCASHRMGAWCVEFTWDAMYFDNTFKLTHPDLRCVDRDGHYIDAMSYIYPEVQDYITGLFTRLAKAGFDAVEMMFHRGVPYVLFEPPFVSGFIEKYGEDPRTLPLDDERVIEARCEVLTGFVRKLRRALDAACPDRKVGLHARGQYSLYECRLNGEDLEAWAREGLITAAISYPQYIREELSGDVWQDGAPGHIDLAKYTKFVNEKESLPILRGGDFRTMDPLPDSRGVPQGPKDMAERVAEWMKLERDHGVRVYFEILPRHMSPEAYKERVLELYQAGAERISLWDTYDRAPARTEWSFLRRIGDKDAVAGFDSGEGTYYSRHRFLRIGGLDVSRYLPGWGA